MESKTDVACTRISKARARKASGKMASAFAGYDFHNY
jgi:hypothetical protein